jgi:hypothetical protein
VGRDPAGADLMVRSMTPGERLALAVEVFLTDCTAPNREGDLYRAHLLYMMQTFAPDHAPSAKLTSKPV